MLPADLFVDRIRVAVAKLTYANDASLSEVFDQASDLALGYAQTYRKLTNRRVRLGIQPEQHEPVAPKN
jgi:hypothetical protein